MAGRSDDKVVSFKKFIRIHQKETQLRWRAHEREHILMERALSKAEEAMNARLEGMNEFRATLEKQADGFASRNSVEELQKFRDRFLGVLFGVTALNAFVSYLIIKILGFK
jgi:hypothetical protein